MFRQIELMNESEKTVESSNETNFSSWELISLGEFFLRRVPSGETNDGFEIVALIRL